MNKDKASHLIDEQLTKLQEARELLEVPAPKAKRGPGRPKGPSKTAHAVSAETRAKIAAAQKKRWAKLKRG